jgi:hypothetical protein
MAKGVERVTAEQIDACVNAESSHPLAAQCSCALGSLHSYEERERAARKATRDANAARDAAAPADRLGASIAGGLVDVAALWALASAAGRRPIAIGEHGQIDSRKVAAVGKALASVSHGLRARHAEHHRIDCDSVRDQRIARADGARSARSTRLRRAACDNHAGCRGLIHATKHAAHAPQKERR